MAARKPALPTSVTVMGVPFRVIWDHVFEDGELGETVGKDRVIRIAPHDGTRGEAAATLLHELIHAVLFVSGLDEILDAKDKALEEAVVRTIEHGLFPLIGTIKAVS